MARERLADGLRFAGAPCPRAKARSALLRVRSLTSPFLGGGKSTPARRACERPMAMACLVERAPCLPFRMSWITSRTNSPACVLGALPSRLSWRALSIVFLSGMAAPLRNEFPQPQTTQSPCHRVLPVRLRHHLHHRPSGDG